MSARNIATYDFSTLYTKLPLPDLIEKLKIITDRAFKGGRNQYISIGYDKAQWTNKEKSKQSFTKEDVYSMIDIVINNTYFQFGNEVYKQVIGMPMGIDPAPPGANIYLHYYEFMEKLTKENYAKAKKYNFTDRYIDDLDTINNDGHLQENISNIYPVELVLNKENTSDIQATFLDLDIRIEDKTITTKTYDKRDAFPFEIINYPNMDSNIPQNQAYGVLVSESLRHFKNCTLLIDATDRILTLQQKLLEKGYAAHILIRIMKKTLHNHTWIRMKYNCTNELIYKMICKPIE